MQRILDHSFQLLLIACVAVTAGLSYVYGIGLILTDRPLTLALGVVLLSPVMMYMLRLLELMRLDVSMKHAIRGAVQMFNPRKQSWAFMYGDTFLLSFAMIALTNGWAYVPSNSWFDSGVWFGVSCAIGILLSMIFALFDWPRYTRIGAQAALVSPTKVWHDWVVFPVLMSLLIFAGVPQLVAYGSFHTVMALIPIVLFVGLGIADLVRDKRGTLRSADQHLLWDVVEFCPHYA